MPTEMTVLQIPLEDRPGRLAAASRAIAGAGINIEAILAYRAGPESAAQFVVTDAAAARAVLEAAGYSIAGERAVMVIGVEDRPGALAEVTAKLAEAGANLNLVYLATGTRLVIGADDLEKLRSSL